MTDIVLGITLKADASGFVGQVKLGQGELEKLGAAGKRAGDQGKAGVDAMGGALGRLKGLALGAVAGFVGFGTVERLIGSIKDEILATERANANLNAVIRATGGAAHLSAYEIGRMADQLERTTLFDDNAIKQAAAVLLTFRNVADDAFGRTLSLAADLAALMGGDLTSAVMTLGKATQDPVEGMMALRRAGIALTEQQQELVEGLVATGRQGEALNVVLDEVARRVGGVAKSQVVGLTGSINDLEDAWGNTRQSFMNTGGFYIAAAAIEAAAVSLNHLNSMLDTTSSFWDTSKGMTTLDVIRALAGRDPEVMGGSSRGGPPLRISPPSGTGFFNFPPSGTDGGGGGGDRHKSIGLRDPFSASMAALQDQQWIESIRLGKQRIDEMNAAAETAIATDQRLGFTLTQELMTPQEQYNESLATYRRLLDEGAIGQDTFTRAVKAAGEELAAADEKADSLGDTMKVVSQDAVHALEDWLVAGGDVHDMLGALEQDLIRLAYRAIVFDPLEKAVGGIDFGDIFGAILGSIFGGGSMMHHGGIPMHTGGIVGRDGGPRRRMPAAIFAQAPRYHAGGMLGADEVPIVGKRGEVIGWPNQMRQAFGGGETVVNVINNSGQPAKTEERRGPGGRRIIDVMIGEATARDITTRGQLSQTLESTYGLSRRGTVR